MLESLCKHIACCIRPINYTDTTNMQISKLTWVLGMYMVKHQLMNNQEILLTQGKLWAMWNVKQDNDSFYPGLKFNQGINLSVKKSPIDLFNSLIWSLKGCQGSVSIKTTILDKFMIYKINYSWAHHRHQQMGDQMRRK